MALTVIEQAAVNALKKLIGYTAYTDDELWAFLSAVGASQNGVAALIWSQKAAGTADLIDIKEGSSTRNLSQLSANATKMAAYFYGLGDGVTDTTLTRRSRTRTIERP